MQASSDKHQQSIRRAENSEQTTEESSNSNQQYAAPSLSLPKGGGAIRGIGEKFAANPVTGTGSMSVPIATSPGRSSFGPDLSLSYDSGAGNGPFGFGWNLAIPSVTRKTDKGLPQYQDHTDSDVFVLSGAEDLVPQLKKDTSGQWVVDNGNYVVLEEERIVNQVSYQVRHYRPRIEGLFARIERWRNTATSEIHWRSISKDNVTSIYGLDENSRIADPDHPHHRIFKWLLCQSYDDKGNVIVYEYKSENDENVDHTQANERNRVRIANRYIKHIYYGNRQPYFPVLDENQPWPKPAGSDSTNISELPEDHWHFHVLFDYGEHDAANPIPGDNTVWQRRNDPFSQYRAGFEVRTYRLCQRVLMFHHFENEANLGKNCLVRSTDFEFEYESDPHNARNPIYSFLSSASQTGYKRDAAGGYISRSMPAVDFGYTKPEVQQTVHEVDSGSLENLPVGVDGAAYQWADLHGEGIPGILTEQASEWFYKPNISPINTEQQVEFAGATTVTKKPAAMLSGGARLLDLAGDGQPDLVTLEGPLPGFYEHDEARSWQNFQTFRLHPNLDFSDPNLKFIDLNGDGRADILISEDDAFTWYPSLAEEGFDHPGQQALSADEEHGPRCVFADSTQSIYLADLSGDGLTDIVRLRNGDVCYWPNLGYAKFGAKVTMDHAPVFDHVDQFQQQRIRLADIDGSGTTDIIYLHTDGIHLYFNQSGNSWSTAHKISAFPQTNQLASVATADLLGNGTACLVWSSPLPGDQGRQMRYLNLMGDNKPHLLVSSKNNLGAETKVQYASSVKFYLQDHYDGKPWITRLPFPVHVVERVETYDHISKNRFVSSYKYHHGYFDGHDREFRGFGMVEQRDTEEIAAISDSATADIATNINEASAVPPVVTKTWHHTGQYANRGRISNYFAGLFDGQDQGEYYREPGLTDSEAKALNLPDTVLPEGLTAEEEREACRSLKGMMLRQEVYAEDKSISTGVDKSAHPYTVVEQNFTIMLSQPEAGNDHAVFFTHPREVLTYHYERNPQDPRIQHAQTLEVDDFGNVLRQVAIGYGRRAADAELPHNNDRAKQTHTLITYSENQVTSAVTEPDAHRTPLPSESRTYELTGFIPENSASRFSMEEWRAGNYATISGASEIAYSALASDTTKEKRLIEHSRNYFLNQTTLDTLLTLGELDSKALPGESYQLAMTGELATEVYVPEKLSQSQLNSALASEAGYVHTESDANWWVPSGRVSFAPMGSANAVTFAKQHFFHPVRFVDPFGSETTVSYDTYDLLPLETTDALDNRISVGARDPLGAITNGYDYRVLQPAEIMDPNRNRQKMVYDALGMVTATAVMGKPEENLGDSLTNFSADLDELALLDHLNDPFTDPHSILGSASTCLLYDLFAYQRSANDAQPQPAVVYSLARETHESDLATGETSKLQHSFSYSDGFGREIQTKIQAEPGVVPLRGSDGAIVVDSQSQPVLSTDTAEHRWVGSGWTVFNNKGKSVRQYEPFFTDTHEFEFEPLIGVSPVLFYDPLARVVATLYPNHTWEKVVFDAWSQTTWDAGDTVLLNPDQDDDVSGFVSKLATEEYTPTWYEQRINGQRGIHEQKAAEKSRVYAGTPETAYLDTLGRPFLTVNRNRVDLPEHDLHNADTDDRLFHTRIEMDIEGKQLAVRDAIETSGDTSRVVMKYHYDMIGQTPHTQSMEAGERWMLLDIAGQPVRQWNSRNFTTRSEYDALRRPVKVYVAETDPADLNSEALMDCWYYGEKIANAEQFNLRGQVHLQLDQAGLITNSNFDFKGNLLAAERQFAVEYKKTNDWTDADISLPANNTALVPLLENEVFTTSTNYDALGRTVSSTSPDGSIYKPSFNEANFIESIHVNLKGADQATVFVTNINYDAKGQRTKIEYGNGVSSKYQYDENTFRLRNLKTNRVSDGDLQNLRYVYDAAGNITRIQDDSQQASFYSNVQIDVKNEYVYDSTNRLIEATGREHLGQTATPHGPFDSFSFNNFQPNDVPAMARYVERYVYDAVGNFLKMQHNTANAGASNWVRNYKYDEASLTETGKLSNRLSETSHGSLVGTYKHDAHGNMTEMPHLSEMRWDCRDQLQATSRQIVIGGTPEMTWYVYDAGGQRVRTVTESVASAGVVPVRLKERVYLGGFEVYREYKNNGGIIEVKHERETLHVMSDEERIALVETLTVGDGLFGESLSRYQIGNHLGSVVCELDADGEIVSFEESFPYGGSSYNADRKYVGVKRFRYSSKERDEENGCYYYGARYYAAWIGRWSSSDPAQLVDGVNLFMFVQCNPVSKFDDRGMLTEDQKENTKELLSAMWSDFKEMTDVTETAFNVKESIDEGEYYEAAGKAIGVDRLAERHLELQDKGATGAEAGVLIVSETIGITQIMEAGTGESLEGDALSSAERWKRGALGVSAASGTIAGALSPKPSVARKNKRKPKTRKKKDQQNRDRGNEKPSQEKTRASGGSDGGKGHANSVSEGGTGDAFAGHGSFRYGDGEVTVPEGTSITMPAPDKRILDPTGRFIEAGDWEGLLDAASQNPRVAADLDGMMTHLPGAKIPNYTLHTPDNLDILSKSMTVESRTSLDQLLKPNMGSVQWAACTEYKR